jgi:hypothetical protein
MRTTALALASAVLFVALPAAEAQVLYGSIVGTVVDQSDAAVPNATVTITSKETGLTRETKTDVAGRYSLVNVLPGTYDLRVAASGFRTLVREDIVVRINAVTRADLQLEVGGVTEQITVTAGAFVLQTDRSEVRAEITAREITNLPLANYRNFQSLFMFVPGATPTTFQNTVAAAPARALTTNVNGTARNNNNARIDGATNVYIWLPHHMVYVPPVESIDTVSISTGSFDAEQGMAGGAAITVATKSGTNEFHGVAYEYHDNHRLATRNFFLPPERDKAKSIRNIFGGTLGGPIVKDRLFFFGSFEAMLERAGVSLTTLSVPTERIRAGDFGGLPVTIYDPLTGRTDGTGRQAFPNNQIPAARIHPISNRLQGLAPLPNMPGTSQGTLNNYYAAGTEIFNRYNYDLKVNWNPASALQVWGKYSRMDSYNEGAFVFGDQLGGSGISRTGVADFAPGDVNIPTFGFTATFSPSFILDGVFSVVLFDNSSTFPGYGKNIGSDVWGIPNTNDPIVAGPQPERLKAACPEIAQGGCYSGMPSISHGFSTWGHTSSARPYFYNERTFTYTTNATKTYSAHELRWGFDLVRYHMDQWQPEVSGGPRGSISFSGDVTGARGYTANYLNQYATFLLGLPTSMSKALQLFQYTNREWQFGWYVRDRWQVSRKLTLNLGLRYEYYPLLTRKDRGIERWDPASNLVYMGRIGGNPDNVGIQVSKRLFAPRFGFAYRVTENTVIRSGYGITIDPLPWSRPLRGMYPSTIASSFVSSTPYSWIDTLDKGIPPIPVPDTSKGVIELPPTIDMGPRSPWGGLIYRGYIQSWNFTVERRFVGDITGSVAYVGTQTVHQACDLDINAAPPGGGPAGRPLAATQNRRIGASMWGGWLSGNYHGLQASLNRRFSRGLLLKGAYTFSKSINWTDEDGWASLPLTNWGPALRRNRAVAGYDRPHMFSLGFVYELPFGPGKSWAQSGPAGLLLRGWQTNGAFSAYSGSPFTISASGTELNMPGTSQTADLVTPGKVRIIGEIGANKMWFDPLAFRQPTGVRFGTTGRNTLYGPGMWNLDFSLFRTFQLGERLRMEFKAEAFNLTNTPKFSNPGANVANMRLNADGTIQTLNNFSSITSTQSGLSTPSERQLRFGLRLSF